MGSEDDVAPVSLERSNDDGDGGGLAALGEGEFGLLEGSSDANESACLLIRIGSGVTVGAETARLGVLRHMYTVLFRGTEAVVVSVK